MLRVVVPFPSPCNSSSLLTTTLHHIFSSSLPNQNCKTSITLHSTSPRNLFFPRRTGFSVSASRKRGKSSISLLGKMDESDDGDEDDDDDDDEMFVPFGQMKNWIENKPPGFGEGKQYDFSIEDKLLEEMQQSRQAQISNLNKLKNSSPTPISKKGLQLEKAPEVVPSGVRVRVENLPKKKNIHRDLKLAFKGFPGIVNISAAVSGNKKTRDPVCKGFAFVDLKSEEDANRFIQIYTKTSMPFGKIQKQIKCEIINPRSHNSDSEQSVEDQYLSAQPTVCSMEEDPDFDCDVDSSEETLFDESEDPNNQIVSANSEKTNGKAIFINMSVPNDDKTTRTATTDESLPLKQQQKKKNSSIQRKKVVKKKSGKGPKLNIPGSANRLKIKEKAVLTDVFSKYGPKAALANHEES